MNMTTAEEIAEFLKLKKESNNRAVLVLGARAGAFFSNRKLYELILRWSKHTSSFENFTEVEKFHECYYVLSQQTKSTVHDILFMSLKEVGYRKEERCLVNLVKAQYFDMIISTNIDGLLELAFDQGNMREPHHYQVFIPEIHTVKNDMQWRPQYCTLVKVFGDFSSRKYTTASREFDWDTDKDFKDFLESTLAKSILVVGYDPVWDGPLERAFPLRGSDFRYVNEELPMEQSLISKAIERRRGKCLIGSYDYFISALHSELLGKDLRGSEVFDEILNQLHQLRHEIQSHTNSPEQDSSTVAQISPGLQSQIFQKEQERKSFPTISKNASDVISESTKQDQLQDSNFSSIMPEKEKRKRVFISYSHKDARHLTRLRTYLASYERNELVDVWDDSKIQVGADWRAEIKKALEETKIAVLLVSADFLASKFIAENELPPLLATAQVGGARIVSIILNPCIFKDTPLYQFQAVNSPSRPLSRMKPHERDEIWLKVAELIMDL